MSLPESARPTNFPAAATLSMPGTSAVGVALEGLTERFHMVTRGSGNLGLQLGKEALDELGRPGEQPRVEANNAEVVRLERTDGEINPKFPSITGV